MRDEQPKGFVIQQHALPDVIDIEDQQEGTDTVGQRFEVSHHFSHGMSILRSRITQAGCINQMHVTFSRHKGPGTDFALDCMRGCLNGRACELAWYFITLPSFYLP
jgi:hypothetical protein